MDSEKETYSFRYHLVNPSEANLNVNKQMLTTRLLSRVVRVALINNCVCLAALIHPVIVS